MEMYNGVRYYSVEDTDNVKFVPLCIAPPAYTVVTNEEHWLAHVGAVAGECYGSDTVDVEKCVARALNCISRGHHSPLEFIYVPLKCTVDRGVSHALVRHRHCVFQQESTIYKKYNKLVVIMPLEVDPITNMVISYSPYDVMDSLDTLSKVSKDYTSKINNGWEPSLARDILPNITATNLIIGTNIRQWMYILNRRTGPGDSHNMHAFAYLLRKYFEYAFPRTLEAFDAWYKKHPL